MTIAFQRYIHVKCYCVKQSNGASTSYFGTYRTSDQRRIMRDCAYAYRLSLHCSHTQSRCVDKGIGNTIGTSPHYKAAHACVLTDFKHMR